MRRRPPKDPMASVPAHLREFRLDDWIAEAEPFRVLPFTPRRTSLAYGAVQAWARARGDYAETYGWPGDQIERLKEQIRVRRSLSLADEL